MHVRLLRGEARSRFEVLCAPLHRPFRQALAFAIGRQPGELASAVRTTVAPTGVSTFPMSGNVIPSLASAHLNFRYLPGQHVII